MAIDFKKWNDQFGGKDALEDLEKASQNEYREVPDGTYNCKLEKLELAESKAGKPMIKGQFRISEGQYKKQCLFVNQVFTRGFPQYKGIEFLRSLQILDDVEVTFDGDFEHFNDMLLDMAEIAESDRMDFSVKKTTEGEYTRLTVMEVFG